MSKTLYEIIRDKKIVIYGTGHVAQKFYLALKKWGLHQNVNKCVVSFGDGKTCWLDNISVQVFKNVNIEMDEIICVAVHYSIKDDVIEAIEQKGVKNYIWIYPYLYEMLLGEPIFIKKKVALDKILETCKQDYRMIARTLVIENYFGKNDFGYDLYVRLQMLHCQKQTAQKRLESFIQLIMSWESSGYDEESVIYINQNYEIIDGAHRVALAKYYGRKELICNQYEMDNFVADIHGEEVMITKDVLISSGFSRDEIQILDKMLEKM